MQFVVELMLMCFYAFGTVLIYVWVVRFWKLYVNQKFMNAENGAAILLELKLPREIDKSPAAMELVLVYLTQSGGIGSSYHKEIKGNLPPTFSLEIASLEGVVKFYIRTHKKFKDLISSALYAQYPGVEVVEVDDYTTQFPRYERHSKVGMWGNGFKLSKEFIAAKVPKGSNFSWWRMIKGLFITLNKEEVKEDEIKLPADFIPIRTYVDMDLDKDDVKKETLKNDPLVSVLEYFGALGKGEYAGLQIIVQDEGSYNFDNDKKSGKFPKLYHTKHDHKHYHLRGAFDLYEMSKRTVIEKKKGDDAEDQYGNPVKDIKKDKEGNVTSDKVIKYQKDVIKTLKDSDLSQKQRDEFEAINKKLSKPIFACMMRTIYVTHPSAKFNANFIQNSLNMMKPFSYPGYNGFGLREIANPYTYPWEEAGGKRPNWRKEEVFDAYIEREGFHPHTGLVEWISGYTGDVWFYPYKSYVRKTFAIFVEGLLHPFGHPHAEGVFCLNTEELATLYHLPGLAAQVPTMPRIESKKSEAPVNLPV